MRKPLHIAQDEWVDATGTALTICVLHELDESSTETYQAIAVVGGMSVCRDHMDISLGLLLHGYDVAQIMELTYEGNLKALYDQGATHEQGVQNSEATTGSVPEEHATEHSSPSADASVNDGSGHDSGTEREGVVPTPHEQTVSGGLRPADEAVASGADQLP